MLNPDGVVVHANGKNQVMPAADFIAWLSPKIIQPSPAPIPTPIPTPTPTPTPLPTPAPSGTADADWVARSTAPGVVLACPFVNPSELTSTDPNFGLQAANDGTICGSLDLSSPLSSNTGWLKFILRHGISDKNIGGALSLYMNKAFAIGDKLYIQWRQKVSPEYLSNNLSYWQSSIKHVNIHGPTKTCQSAEVVCYSEPNTSGQFNRTLLYTNCGDGFDVPLAGGDILIQQGSSDTDGYNCHYQNQIIGTGNGVGCLALSADIVQTFDMEIDLLADGSATVTGWVTLPGGAKHQFQKGNHTGFFADDHTLERIRLETYMTQIAKAASVDAFVWYSQLIVSTQPIASPNG